MVVVDCHRWRRGAAMLLGRILRSDDTISYCLISRCQSHTLVTGSNQKLFESHMFELRLLTFRDNSFWRHDTHRCVVDLGP